MLGGWPLAGMPNISFTDGRDNTTIVKTPSTVPNGKKAHCKHPITKTNQ